MKVVSGLKDSRKVVELKAPDDRLKLFIDITPAVGVSDFTVNEILDVVQKGVRVDLIDVNVISDIVAHLNKGESCKERRIAKGKAAEPGVDGKIVWLVKKLGSEGEVKTDERGFADFVHMHLFDNISVGQKLLRIYRPKPGTPGFDFAGKQISAVNGKAVAIRPDSTVTVESQPDEGYDILVSQAAGYAFQQGDVVGVRDTLTISSDLDYHFGSIDFIGSVVVTGDVHKGFSIRSEKSIAVHGSIQGENELSAREAIKVGGTHFGGPKSSVSSSGWFQVKNARGINVDSDGPIVVQKEAFDCELTSRDIIYGPKAAVIGGELRCVHGVEVWQLGNEAGKTTIVQLCVGPEATAEFARLELEIQRHEEAANLLRLHLGPFASLGVRIERLNEPQRTRVKKLFEKLQLVEKSVARLQLKKKNFLQTTSDGKSLVTVLSMLYAGVVIRRRDVLFTCTDTIVGPVTIQLNAETGKLEQSEVEHLPEPILTHSEADKSK